MSITKASKIVQVLFCKFGLFSITLMETTGKPKKLVKKVPSRYNLLPERKACQHHSSITFT